jgi:acetylornithine deacetylase
MKNMSTENNSDLLFNNSVKILTDLISFKTVSGEDNTALIDYCDDILKKLGATSFRTYDDEKKRVNLFATLKAKNANNKKPIILSGHTDVVPVSKGWSSDPFTATIKEDKLFGRGSCDMKGFIACTLAFAPIYSKSNLDRDIHFSFTFDEETACIGAPILIEELKRRNIKDGICIVGEPTNMKIIDAHKGCYEYTTYFKGLARHSSAPHKGVSAVEYASRYVNKLIELREKLREREPKDSIFDPPHSTLSIGGVFGGIAHNVIADKCHVNWETRPVVKEDGVFLNQEIDNYANEVLLPDMKKIFPNASIEKNIIGEIVGFDREDKSDACEFISSLTGDNSRQVVSFGTEAGLFQEIGISTVVCGPGSIEQAHKIDEFIVLDELKKCLDLLDGIKNNSVPN